MRRLVDPLEVTCVNPAPIRLSAQTAAIVDVQQILQALVAGHELLTRQPGQGAQALAVAGDSPGLPGHQHVKRPRLGVSPKGPGRPN